MEDNLTRIIKPSSSEVEKFLLSAGESLNSFRYFSKRNISVIDSHILTILYRNDDKYVGYGHLDREGDRIWLGICLAEDERGKGIGKIVMQDLTKFAKTRGLDVNLLVDNENTRAISLYQKFGFVNQSQLEKMTFMRASFQDSGYFTKEEMIEILGIREFGENVKISKRASVYGGRNIKIGSNVRIDDYCVISATGELIIEGHNHISSFCYINSRGGVRMKMFSGLSSRCSIYTATDDYSGEHLTNPTVPEDYAKIIVAPVVIGRHTIVGTGSTILPGVTIEDCCSIGAHTLVNKSIPYAKIAVGVPAKIHKERSTNLLNLEKKLLERKWLTPSAD